MLIFVGMWGGGKGRSEESPIFGMRKYITDQIKYMYVLLYYCVVPA